MILGESEFMKRYFLRKEYEFDIIVIGAGIAGISAAISAARQGAKTALITDRPIFGGSASSEIRVGPGGADFSPWNYFARETGIIEEIFNHIHFQAQNVGKWRWHQFDEIYFDMVMNEPNLSSFLNTTIFKADMENHSTISWIEGIQLRSETIIKFKGKMFIDCSGDGTVGYLAGADYRIGRESKEEFKEVFAPEEADRRTMGATLLFTSVNTGHPVSFSAPDWAVKFNELSSLKRLKPGINKMPDGTYYGFWWAEYGGQLDSIHDDAEIIWHLRKLVYGIWHYIKNSGLYPEVENHEINWIGYLPGKRESRRLVGPYIATSLDFLSQKKFEDRIGFTGWPIDIHPPEGYLSNQPGCTHEYLPGITDIPFKCIYSRNISNLLFAGRNISATHEGLGTLRVIPTTAVMGQAAGTAAAMCIKKNIVPDDIRGSDFAELQRRLVRMDQSIIGYCLQEKNDYSRKAIISSSSQRKAAIENTINRMSMDKRYGMIIPVATEKITQLTFYLKANSPQTVKLEVYACDDRCENYRIKEKVNTVRKTVAGEGWYQFDVNIDVGSSKKIFAIFDKNPMVQMYFSDEMMTGFLGIETIHEGTIEYNTIFEQTNSSGHVTYTPCFRIYPEQSLYSAANINDGYIRPYGLPHIWASDEKHPFCPEWIRFDFNEEKKISRIELVFNSELNHKRLMPTINRVNPQMIKAYEIIAVTTEGEVTIVCRQNNYKRFVVHEFDAVNAKAVKLVVHETWGSKYVEVYDMRIYE